MVTNLPGVVVGPRLTLDNVNARLVELEQVVANITKTDPFEPPTDDLRVEQLERANQLLREQVEAKDDEISRLTDIIGRNEEKIDELNDKLYDITHILGV